jgi:hypothetical protein
VRAAEFTVDGSQFTVGAPEAEPPGEAPLDISLARFRTGAFTTSGDCADAISRGERTAESGDRKTENDTHSDATL